MMVVLPGVSKREVAAQAGISREATTERTSRAMERLAAAITKQEVVEVDPITAAALEQEALESKISEGARAEVTQMHQEAAQIM